MESAEIREVILQQSTPEDRGDDCIITSAWIDGDELRLSLAYSGGCREHQFDVVAVPEGTSRDLRLHLRHDTNGEDCKALMRTTQSFSLRSVAALRAKDKDIWLTLPEIGRLRYPAAARGEM